MKRKDIDKRKEEIIHLYCKKQYSQSKIAKLMNCDFEVINRILKENNINLNSISFYNKGNIPQNKMNLSKKKIINLYLKKEGLIKIAKRFNCSTTPIYRILKENKIKIRGTGNIKGKPQPNISLSHKGKPAWNKGKKCPYAKLNPQVFKKGQTPWNKGKKVLKIRGPKHHNWQGGKSFEPYGLKFNKELREQIRERDNHRCQQCFRHQDELFTKTGRHLKLDIHHIDFNKQNNNPENLLSLCRNCHSQTQFNKENWVDYFQNKIREMK